MTTALLFFASLAGIGGLGSLGLWAASRCQGR
jgi:hypothetical protein